MAVGVYPGRLWEEALGGVNCAGAGRESSDLRPPMQIPAECKLVNAAAPLGGCVRHWFLQWQKRLGLCAEQVTGNPRGSWCMAIL